MRDRLHTVADAENRRPRAHYPIGKLGRARLIDTGRSTGKDEATRLEGKRLLLTNMERQELAVYTGLAQPPDDELAILRSKVEDDNRLIVLHEASLFILLVRTLIECSMGRKVGQGLGISLSTIKNVVQRPKLSSFMLRFLL